MVDSSANQTSNLIYKQEESLAHVLRNPDFTRVAIRYDLLLTSGCFHLPKQKSIWLDQFPVNITYTIIEPVDITSPR